MVSEIVVGASSRPCNPAVDRGYKNLLLIRLEMDSLKSRYRINQANVVSLLTLDAHNLRNLPRGFYTGNIGDKGRTQLSFFQARGQYMMIDTPTSATPPPIISNLSGTI